jgi:hypothetical protein
MKYKVTLEITARFPDGSRLSPVTKTMIWEDITDSPFYSNKSIENVSFPIFPHTGDYFTPIDITESLSFSFTSQDTRLSDKATKISGEIHTIFENNGMIQFTSDNLKKVIEALTKSGWS